MSPGWTVTPSWNRAPPPEFIAPCLPALVDHVPAGPDWLHELKWDGYRIIARKEGWDVKLWSRAGIGWHGTFPVIATVIAALPTTSLMLDGEAVVLREDGTADFYALRSQKGRIEARMIVFDLLEVDGQDTRALPLEERRERLAAVLDQRPSPSLLLSEAVEGDDKGALLFRHACAINLEGIVSKRKGSPYISGPTSSWCKIKCPNYVRAGEERPPFA